MIYAVASMIVLISMILVVIVLYELTVHHLPKPRPPDTPAVPEPVSETPAGE